ncbi:MAG: H(+)/Cl(-) exchange transporter ClcA [Planctomycetota bacterium]|nr:MAG: H(+)/Cl(-) exchange transporter ClcA [Planctomycetota bacterium]
MTDPPSGNPQNAYLQEAAGAAPQSAQRRFLEAEGLRPMTLFLWAALLGSLVGLVGGVFQLTLTSITDWTENLAASFAGGPVLWWLIPTAFSAVVVYASFLLVRHVAPETSGSGVQEIEGGLDDLRPLRWRRVLPVKFVAGLLSLSGRMVLGREGPTIQMGGNLGKMFGDLFKLSNVDVHTLIAAGAGAGLSAAFNAPLAGILFVVEEMRPQFKYNFLSVHSVLIASVMSDIVLRALMGQLPDIEMPILEPPPLASLWLFPILGVFFGVFGVVFNKLLVFTLDFFASLQGWAYSLTGLIVGAGVGLLGALRPEVVGGGYEVIPLALSESIPIGMMLGLFIARFGSTMLSYGSGAPGGIFAPMLALATVFGMWSGHYAHDWFPDWVAHPQIFAVAGMGALFSATVRAPLTGIALTIEMTGNYELILPLILTCMVAAIVAQGLGGRPIYTVLLERTLKRAEVQDA